MENLIDTMYIRYDINTGHGNDEFIKLKGWLDNHYPDGSKFSQIKGSLPEYKYKIKNLDLTLTLSHLYVRGSLTKYYFGNNFERTIMSDMNGALNKLNDDLGHLIQIEECYVRRLDLGLNLVMNNKPDDYIVRIYDSAYNKKDVRYFNKTVVKGNKSRSVVIYNKTDEVNSGKCNKQGTVVPENLLRFEIRIVGKHVFEKYFGSKMPTVSDIFNQAEKFPYVLKQEYDKLEKKYEFTGAGIACTSDLYSYALKIVGHEKLMSAIDHSYNNGLLDYQNKYRITKTIKSVFKAPNSAAISVQNDLISELDIKFQDWYVVQTKFI